MSHNNRPAEAVDAKAVLRDDVLVDALAKGVLPMEYHEDPLIRSLLTWRDDITAAPFEPAAELDVAAITAEWRSAADDETKVLSVVYNDFPRHEQTATAVPAPAGPPVQREASPEEEVDAEEPEEPARRRFRWVKRPVLVAAAISAIALGSLGSVAAANVAEPGSPLWPIAKAVNPERAESLEAREAALASIEQARRALDHDDPAVALQHLQEAQTNADSVRSQDGKGDLKKELELVRRGVDGPVPTPNPTLPTPQPTPGDTPSPDPSDSPTPTPTPSDSTTPTKTPSPTGTPSKPTSS